VVTSASSINERVVVRGYVVDKIINWSDREGKKTRTGGHVVDYKQPESAVIFPNSVGHH
jgi:hypothetical protein